MKVFISSSSNDKDFVDKLSVDLSKSGIETWNPLLSVSAGTVWADETSKNIKGADALIAILSRNSLESRFVTAEISFGISEQSKKNKPVIIPIILDKKAHIPLFLGELRYVDFSEPSKYSESLKILNKALRKIETSDYNFSKMYSDIGVIKAEQKMLQMQEAEISKIQAKFNKRIAMFSTIIFALIGIFFSLWVLSSALSKTLWPFLVLIFGFLTGVFFSEIRTHLKRKQGLKKKKYGRAK